MTATATKPDLYFFLSWHELRKRCLTIEPGDLLAALKRVHGSVPDELATEELVRLFSDRVGVPLTELEFEDGLIPGHSAFAPRSWVRDEYKTFLDWCLETGWLDADVAERTKWELPKAPPTPEVTPEPKFEELQGMHEEELRKFMESSGLAAALARAKAGPEPEPTPVSDIEFAQTMGQDIPAEVVAEIVKPKKKGRA